MPLFQDLFACVDAARAHVNETGHEIIQADDIPLRRIGYACLDCGNDPNTVWEVPVAFLRFLPEGHPFREYIRTAVGREQLVREINTNAKDPIGFESAWRESDIGPQEELERLSRAVWGRR